jgi:hypothetical protein
VIDERLERGRGGLPESIEEAIEELDYRDENEEDPEGRMTDLLPAPDDDFEDEAVATETEDDYSDESDADVAPDDAGN